MIVEHTAGLSQAIWTKANCVCKHTESRGSNGVPLQYYIKSIPSELILCTYTKQSKVLLQDSCIKLCKITSHCKLQNVCKDS